MIEKLKMVRPSNVVFTLLVFAILGIAPLFINDNYILSVGVTFCVFAGLGTSWNLIGGYAHQICWCQAAFLAIGAYTSFLLYNLCGITPWLGMPIGMAISAVAAVIIGSVSFRLRGPFFSLTTIAFGELVRIFLLYKKDLTKGANGLVVTFRSDSFLNMTFRSDRSYYYILLALLIISVAIAWYVEKSRLGYYLRAIRADEDAVRSLGINSNVVKLKAFVISACIASAIGTVYAFFLSYIDPASVGGLDLSTKIGSMAIVGGMGTLSGPLLGAAVLVPMSELANKLLGTSGSGMLLYGLLLIIVFLFRPKGIRSFFGKHIFSRGAKRTTIDG
jgi:branched-chain amino acid transport system permease protein